MYKVADWQDWYTCILVNFYTEDESFKEPNPLSVDNRQYTAQHHTFLNIHIRHCIFFLSCTRLLFGQPECVLCFRDDYAYVFLEIA